MDPTFNYRRIGTAFTAELQELVSSGQSTVLLGLRDLGKRYVLKQLGAALREEGSMLVVQVEFPHEPALLEPVEVQKLILAAVKKAAPGFNFAGVASPEALLDVVKKLCSQQPRRVALLISNVDSLAHHLAQTLLREARVLVSDARFALTAVLTGEENLRSLVYGPESEFNCTRQFVLQGFEEEAYLDYLRRRRETARIDFANEPACQKLLYAETRGNAHLGRAALWAWQETQARVHDRPEHPVTENEFSEFLLRFPATEACGMDAFSQSTRVIAATPESWEALEAVRESKPVPAPEGSAPHVLELAGLAIRQDGRLEYASPIMERFARQFYDDCRLGDLHAVQGDWENAFRFYSQMRPAHQVRPNGATDLPRLALVIKAFIAKMHTLATRPAKNDEAKLNALKSFFADGCKLVLGVSDVTYWKYIVKWEAHPGQSIAPAVRNLAEDVLQEADRSQLGWQKVDGVLGKRAVRAILPSVETERSNAVVVSDASLTVAISRERGEFLHELLDQFTNAYDHITVNWRVKKRMEARRRHLEIATKIVSAIGETIHNPDAALKLAGDELLNLGYRRIMFAMVDPHRQHIRGVRFCCGQPPKKDVAKATDYLLSQYLEDIQPWVVHHQKPCRVNGWQTWNKSRSSDVPPINENLSKDAETASNFAVAPMIRRFRLPDGSWGEEVFGTIHLEREDGQPLTDDDIDDLLEFGRQLAAAGHEAERVGALLDALHCDQDSVLVFDEDGLVRFANKKAAERFSIEPKWYEAHEAKQLADSELVADVQQVIDSNTPLAKHDIARLPGKTRHEALIYTPLSDWRKLKDDNSDGKARVEPAVGAVLQVHDFTDLDRVFAALQTVARKAIDRESAISTVLGCVDELGYKSVRLYLVDPHCPAELRSERALGLVPEYAEKFEKGAYHKNRNDEDCGDTWQCLETGEPIVNQWNTSPKAPAQAKTARGVTVHNLSQPTFKLPWKKPGDVWIDLPLQARGEAIGKLTVDLGTDLQCDLEPRDFELLKIFSALLGGLLAALDKEQWMHEASERAMADTAHKIGTKLAGLSGFAEDYRRAAPGNSQVESINRWMEPTVQDCFALVKQVKEGITGSIGLKRTPTSIRPMLEKALEGILGHERRNKTATWQMICPEDLRFSLDEARFRYALEAMLDNSRAMTPATQTLVLKLRAEVFNRGNKDWLRLHVSDNGSGIPVEQRERIFGLLYSCRPGGRRSTGLGLSYVQRVIAAHGGAVLAVEPTEPGAKFIIEIPDQP